MFEFNSADIIPTEVFPIPQLIKAARVPPLNSLIELLVPPESDAVEWPEFHSGVASALKIKRNCPDLNSSWIVFNQSKSADGPNQIDSAHAGFIFGLGLLGHLKKLDSADSLRNYFLPGFEILSVGHLLGLAAAHLGSRNTQITNMVSVHLPSMLPAHSVELSSGSILKAGAIVGYGLLHFQHPTQYKLDKVLKELESFSFSENSIENAGNESYMNACGFALVFYPFPK
jgi:anaphase-promoting complex subunit 1